MNLYTYPVQSKDVQFNQTQTTMVTAALTLQAKARALGALRVGQDGDDPSATGDQVDISPEAKARAAAPQEGQQRKTVESGLAAAPAEQAGAPEDAADSVAEQARQRIQKRIQELQQELRQVQADAGLTREDKARRVQQLQTELMTLRNELAQQEGGAGYAGGTVAQGMARSLT